MWSFIIALALLPITYGYTGESEVIMVPRAIITEQEDYTITCSQEPLELGIVLDSSSSIWQPDFNKAIAFLQNYLRELDIGSGPDNIRVSIILYGKGIYTDDAFNLTTYNTKQEVIDAIGRIVHAKGLYTDTGKGIEYMRTVQLAEGVVRPEVTKVGLVITDGDSQDRDKTKDQAKLARDDGIVMFAVGVGRAVRDQELYNIAGDRSRVARVDSYNQLNSIIKKLANMTCIKTPKTTTPIPESPPCGVLRPSDVYFVFSPADLGTTYTTWTTSFISRTISSENMDIGFRYGVISGSCPDDAGFNLDRYSNVNDIRQRIRSYDVSKLVSLTQQLAYDGFTAKRGARENSEKVAVLFVGSEKSSRNLAAEVDKLVRQGVKVFIADPLGISVRISGAITLQGQVYNQVSELVNYLCHK